MTFQHTTGHQAPPEHPEDGRRVALIFAAAHAGCGLRVCGWCGKWMGLAKEIEAGAVTHSICDNCRNRWEVEAERELTCAPKLEVAHA